MAIQPVGYLKLYRELFDKPIWVCATTEQKVLLITLLCMANFKEKEWEFEGKKYKCKAGEFITSVDSIKKNCGKGISVHQIRTGIARLEKYEFLTSKSSNKNTLITITNWSLYQVEEDKVANKVANKWQTDGKQVATREESKESKETYIDDFFETIWLLYPRKEGKSLVKNPKRKELYKLGYDKVKICIDRYLNEAKPEYYYAGKNFFNYYCTDFLDENYKVNNPKSDERAKFIERAMELRDEHTTN